MVGDILQPTHLLFVLLVALLVLGPKRLPEVGRTLGSGLRDFRDALSGESSRDHYEHPAPEAVQAAPEQRHQPPVEPDPAPVEPDPAPVEPAATAEPAASAESATPQPLVFAEPAVADAQTEPDA
jgi:sec-independent protein translocase protein TatA